MKSRKRVNTNRLRIIMISGSLNGLSVGSGNESWRGSGGEFVTFLKELFAALNSILIDFFNSISDNIEVDSGIALVGYSLIFLMLVAFKIIFLNLKIN